MNDVYKVRPVSPWMHLMEEIHARDWAVSDLRRMLHIDRTTFDDFLRGRIVIKGHLARELARVFDTDPEFWVNLDRQWREGR